MKKNMGTADRILRLVLAVVFYMLYATQTVAGTAGVILFILAVVFVVTSLFSFCPLYRLFGVNTCKAKQVR